ncbi:MAG: hypothetical protein ACREBC_37270, partial [Pyrinomonadaceae bacterium]
MTFLGTRLACVAIYLSSLCSNAAAFQLAATDLTRLAGQAVNRTATSLIEDGKRGLRLSEGSGLGLVWVPKKKFSTGTIQVDLRGKDIFQGSFVGIAFHGLSNSHYEVVYLRPFNFRAPDKERRSHAIQYVSLPTHTWSKLRSNSPGEFESSVSESLDPNGWVHLRLEVFDNRVQAFVGDARTPTLEVERLSSPGDGLVGLWVGGGSGGDFANLPIESRSNLDVRVPTKPEVFIDRFKGSEGITFNGEGRLFIGADEAIWIAEPDGAVQKIADVSAPLGLARIGARDILAADFGPTNVFQHGPNT